MGPTDEVKVREAAYYALSAASAASAALSADSAAALSAVRADASRVAADDGHRTVFDAPLWPDAKPPAAMAENWDTLLAFFDTDPATWSFWTRWYEDLAAGTPPSFALQEDIALIPDDIWREGPARVAEEIAKIELKYRTAIDRRVIRDEQKDIFRLEKEQDLPTSLLRFAAERVESTLENTLTAGPPNGLTEMSYETVVLRRALNKHREEGSLLAVSFLDACFSLDQKIGDIYPDDPSLTVLKNALWTTAEELCENDPEIRKRVETYVQITFKVDVSAPDREEIRKIPEVVADLVDEELDERIREASDIVANAEKPPASWRARLTNWVTTITIWMDRTQKGDKRLQWLTNLVERMRKWFDDDMD